jgi:hypothetical protein
MGKHGKKLIVAEGRCIQMEAQLPDKPNEVETYKNEEKDQAVE